MFGYIKVEKNELLFKDFALYRAVYCGVCESIRKNISKLLPFSLSYDFVFLAIARDIIEENEIKIKNGRCHYNPLKKKSFYSSKGVDYASIVSLILVKENIRDKRLDKDYKALSPVLWLFERHLSKKINKRHQFSELFLGIEKRLLEFYKLEKESSSTDELCEAFGDVMGFILSFGLENENKRISYSLGKAIGSWLFLADAVDDIEKDFKKGSFNPLIQEYKTPDNVKKHFKEIDVSFGAYANDGVLALSLMPKRDITRIAENILTLGLGREAYRIMNKQGESNDRPI